MFENMTEEEARRQILESVGEYCDKYHNRKSGFEPGDRITYASRVYDRAEMMNLVDSSLEFWLTAGRYTDQFEKSFENYLGVRFCSLVNSGSSANLLAFMTLTSPLLDGKVRNDGEESESDRSSGRGIKKRVLPGDEIITVAAGFPTTVAPIIQYGAIPVFVDVTIPEYNIDVSKLADALSDKTRAVMVAHTLGNPFDLRAVKEFCDKNGLWLIEDNCDALGSRYEMEDGWQFTGTVGDIGTSSFYPPHHMTMGEGGAVYTDNPLLNKIARSLRDWGRDCVCPSGKDNLCGHRFDGQYGELPFGYDHKYVYSHFGYNLKATDMQAAIGCAQLEKFPSFVEKRKRNFNHLYDGLKEKSCSKGFDIEDKLILPKASEYSDPSWFGFMMTCRDGIDRKEVVEKIEKSGIQTRALFAGNLTKHPCFDEMRSTGRGFRIVGDLSNTDAIMERSFWVGVYPGMTDEMLDYMSATIVDAISNA
jgi:CDP-6-deoxy-D-xylo-4-hexulose-3-dehydrase